MSDFALSYHPSSSDADAPTYSFFVDPDAYNVMMSDEHLYIGEADVTIIDFVKEHVGQSLAEVVELGCGPGRLLPGASGRLSRVHLSAIDVDEEFVRYAEHAVNGAADVLVDDAVHYRHDKRVDAFFSQGFHHHVQKGPRTTAYLRNVAGQLSPSGIYVLGDEFLPSYPCEAQRRLRAVIWYSHIIAGALSSGFTRLAEEETKTLMDDLTAGESHSPKTAGAIEQIIQRAPVIAAATKAGRGLEATRAALQLISVVGEEVRLKYSGSMSPDMEYSRGDFKISIDELRREAWLAGLEIIHTHRVGPSEDIGGLVVAVLRCRR